jgi:hypothetical protein
MSSSADCRKESAASGAVNLQVFCATTQLVNIRTEERKPATARSVPNTGSKEYRTMSIFARNIIPWQKLLMSGDWRGRWGNAEELNKEVEKYEFSEIKSDGLSQSASLENRIDL